MSSPHPQPTHLLVPIRGPTHVEDIGMDTVLGQLTEIGLVVVVHDAGGELMAVQDLNLEALGM